MPKVISSTRLDFLFRPPTVRPPLGWNSTVHLVRRECQETLANIKRHVPEELFPGKRPPHRLFASSIVICSAVDLLGKLAFGDEEPVNKTFRLVLTRYGGLPGIEAKRIWDVRNALTHSFGVRRILPARRKKGQQRPARVSTIRTQLTDEIQAGAVIRLGQRRWQLSVPSLYRLFSDVMVNIERDLRGPRSQKQVTQFNRMFLRYGRIRIR